MIKLTVIIPVFNEAENIAPLLKDIQACIGKECEIIYVDDGSTDDTVKVIEEISNTNPAVKCICFSRNFGHQNALMAGMQHAAGEYIVLMDGDGQHPPHLINKMLQLLEEGFDMVNTTRQKTGGSGIFKNVTARFFYKFINVLSDTRIEPNQADFRAFNRKVLNAVLQFEERELFLRGIFSWVGFKTTTLSFDAPARAAGKTKYSFARMMKLALKATTSFSFKPLRLAFIAGSTISLLSFSFGIFALIEYYKGHTVPGWASLIIAIMFLGGTQLLAIGLLGEYIASLFTESKKRPLYIARRKINLD